MYIVYKTVFNEVIKHLQGPCELHLQYLFRKDSIVAGVTFQPLITYQDAEYIRIIPNTYILSWFSINVGDKSVFKLVWCGGFFL